MIKGQRKHVDSERMSVCSIETEFARSAANPHSSNDDARLIAPEGPPWVARGVNPELRVTRERIAPEGRRWFVARPTTAPPGRMIDGSTRSWGSRPKLPTWPPSESKTEVRIDWDASSGVENRHAPTRSTKKLGARALLLRQAWLHGSKIVLRRLTCPSLRRRLCPCRRESVRRRCRPIPGL